MKAKYILSSLAILGGIALAAPSFAQDRSYAPGVPAGSLGMDWPPAAAFIPGRTSPVNRWIA